MDVCVAGSDLQSRHAHDKDLFLKTHVKKWNSRCVDVNKTDSTRQKIYTIATHQLAEKTKSNRVAPIFPHCCYWVMSCHYTTLQYFPNSRLRFTHSLVTHKSVEYKANEIKRIRYQQFRNSAEKKKHTGGSHSWTRLWVSEDHFISTCTEPWTYTTSSQRGTENNNTQFLFSVKLDRLFGAHSNLWCQDQSMWPNIRDWRTESALTLSQFTRESGQWWQYMCIFSFYGLFQLIKAPRKQSLCY